MIPFKYISFSEKSNETFGVSKIIWYTKINIKNNIHQNKNTSMKEFHNLMTNTTTLVGYIAILMFAGSYLGGDGRDAINRISTLNPTLFKGSVLESSNTIQYISTKSVTITIDGRQYEAMIEREVSQKPEFQY